uniref:Uncharacterized protein n=1 Tax=Siphoviridae sp. ctEgn5 TaxID=2825398 RepID=A0A8S5PFR7_9CAUD|nr:MAG TPA: hypothetical protein [Siphoviridae sp. ctEgn5]
MHPFWVCSIVRFCISMILLSLFRFLYDIVYCFTA